MKTVTWILDDEELTQYFENPIRFERNLARMFPTLECIELGDWVNESENRIELKLLLA